MVLPAIGGVLSRAGAALTSRAGLAGLFAGTFIDDLPVVGDWVGGGGNGNDQPPWFVLGLMALLGYVVVSD